MNEHMNEDRYPNTPGFSAPGTSEEAAASMEPCAETLRASCVGILSTGEFTSDEIASKLGASVLAIRPRITELKKLGVAKKTGVRRPNRSGRFADVIGLVK